MNADIVMGRFVNGTFEVKDKWAYSKNVVKGDNPTILDTDLGGEDNILLSAGSRQEGKTYMRFQRTLSTGDKWDHRYLNEVRNFIIAFNPTNDSLVFHGRNNAQNVQVNLIKGNAYVIDLLPTVHGALMVAGWGFFIALGMVVSRFVFSN